jgi:hypothetical protein
MGYIARKALAIFFICTILQATAARRPIIVIDPAGHARDVGRLLVEGYERAQTLKFAQALQKELIKKYQVRPIITREPGEEISHQLQIPSFCNRLCGATGDCTAFFLRINMYREERVKPRLSLYHLLFNPLVDLAPRDTTRLQLIPLQEAHVGKIHITRFWGNKMYEYLHQDTFTRYFDCYPLQGIALKALIGITVPAILLEIGICRENKWKSLVTPVVDSLGFLNTLGG